MSTCPKCGGKNFILKVVSTCPKCGGNLIGDGYSSVIHCEYADDPEMEFAAPDEGPFYCDFED